ncbi:unnamed protein product, partial [Meganyctiphanes norvegica]
MFRQHLQRQFRQAGQDPAMPWACLACICRGRVVLKLLLGITVLLLAVNIWPGPQLLCSDCPESYTQPKPVTAAITIIAESQLMSPPIEQHIFSSNDTQSSKVSTSGDGHQAINNDKEKVNAQRYSPNSLKHSIDVNDK